MHEYSLEIYELCMNDLKICMNTEGLIDIFALFMDSPPVPVDSPWGFGKILRVLFAVVSGVLLPLHEHEKHAHPKMSAICSINSSATSVL